MSRFMIGFDSSAVELNSNFYDVNLGLQKPHYHKDMGYISMILRVEKYNSNTFFWIYKVLRPVNWSLLLSLVFSIYLDMKVIVTFLLRIYDSYL